MPPAYHKAVNSGSGGTEQGYKMVEPGRYGPQDVTSQGSADDAGAREERKTLLKDLGCPWCFLCIWACCGKGYGGSNPCSCYFCHCGGGCNDRSDYGPC